MILKKFFAVTHTSLYESSYKEGELPLLQKILLKEGCSSKVEAGGILENGSLVGICNSRIFLYDNPAGSENRIDPAELSTLEIGGYTSLITALFLRKKEARACLKADNLLRCDPRWANQTRETVTAIGDDHPVFVVSKFSPPCIS